MYGFGSLVAKRSEVSQRSNVTSPRRNRLWCTGVCCGKLKMGNVCTDAEVGTVTVLTLALDRDGRSEMR